MTAIINFGSLTHFLYFKAVNNVVVVNLLLVLLNCVNVVLVTIFAQTK